MIEEELMTWQQFDDACKNIAKQIEENNLVFDRILTIPRGGLTIAARLAHLLNIEDIYFNPDETKDLEKVLFVDDISDTGESLIKNFPGNTPYCKTATLYYKPETSKFKPDFYVLEIDKWVVFPWEEEHITVGHKVYHVEKI